MGRTGKIERNLLDEVVTQKTGFRNPNVLQGPKFGVDTALIRTGETSGLVSASDPTSLVPSLGVKDSAWISVILTANDVATSGFLPQYAQFIFNFPTELKNSEFKDYWHHIDLFCQEMGIAITGGHTGFSSTGPTTISGGVTMFSQVSLPMAKSSAYVQPDQNLILTKSAALSSSAILAKSFPNYTSLHLGKEVQQELAGSLYQMSILDEVKILRSDKELFSQISGMHDCTEGGVLGAIYELCQASGTGVQVHQEKIPLGKEQEQICRLFNINPYRSIAAGSLLIACQKKATEKVIALLAKNGIKAEKVGHTLKKQTDRSLITSNGTEALEYLEEDPYWNAFFNALNKKLN